jgi:adenine-specific DNA-methyltransferase
MIVSAMKRGDYFCISYARDEEMFGGPKIVCPQWSYTNSFGYNEVPWYAGSDVSFITRQNPTVALKFILALLNSKLFFAWLFYKGKRKGGMLELCQKPLSDIPIKVISHQEQKPFVSSVDKILAAKQRDVSADTSALEDEIDKLVYALYGLTSAEIKHVENALPKSRSQTSENDDDDSE